MVLIRTLFCIVCVFATVQSARAHYLWVTIDQREGAHGTAKVYFEESPAAGDGSYLDHFTETSRTWIRTIESISPRTLKTTVAEKDDKRWLEVELPEGAPRSLQCYGKFGVYRYGKTDVLLHYYARFLDVNSHDALHALGEAPQMALEMVPHDDQDNVELKVLWKGDPVPDRIVYVRGPKRFRENIKTDSEGVVRFVPPHSGRYTFRTSVEENKAGTDGDQEYSLIRHNGTLIMTLPLNK